VGSEGGRVTPGGGREGGRRGGGGREGEGEGWGAGGGRAGSGLGRGAGRIVRDGGDGEREGGGPGDGGCAAPGPRGGEVGVGGAGRGAARARRRAQLVSGAYVVSLSFRTVTYKALCAADQLARFYPDLRDPRLAVSFAILHQRFSTNTAPSWENAQPFRLLCHNGEINSIDGNAAWMRARRTRLQLDGPELGPVLERGGSREELATLLSRQIEADEEPGDASSGAALAVRVGALVGASFFSTRFLAAFSRILVAN